MFVTDISIFDCIRTLRIQYRTYTLYLDSSFAQLTMDNFYTFVIKFGDHNLAKRCSRGFSREELVTYVAAKCAGITTTNISLSYDLRGSGEVDLMDEEDMDTMFMLLDEMQTRRVHVYVKRIDGGSSRAPPVVHSEPSREIVEYGTNFFQEQNDDEMELVVQTARRISMSTC